MCLADRESDVHDIHGIVDLHNELFSRPPSAVTPTLSPTRGVTSTGHEACRTTAPETLPSSARRTGP